MFERILVANRGEIACRIIRACHALGIEAVAVHSEADAEAPHTRAADRAVEIGPPAPLESYLHIERLIGAARDTGCDAVHPGYGFLSENPDLVLACEQAGLAFIGPTADAMRLMGDKVQARAVLGEAGLPLVPSSSGVCEDVGIALQEAEQIGYPVMVKAARGGGGIGMKRVDSAVDLEKALTEAANRSKAAFGSPAVYLEKCIQDPHHIEVQVLADGSSALHLFERECSVQRRFQKVIEEARAPFASAPADEMTSRAARAVGEVGYVNAGTVECLVSGQGDWYFLEINRRIQVEHPATEMITGRDLVAAQIHIAAEGTLPFSQDEIHADGHAIEFRIYAEDPFKFFPSPGTIDTWNPPEGDGIRLDAGVEAGSAVPMFYDPLLAKLIVHGPTRSDAIERARGALATFEVTGVKTNIALHRKVLDDEVFQAGDYTTDYLPALIRRLKEKGEI